MTGRSDSATPHRREVSSYLDWTLTRILVKTMTYIATRSLNAADLAKSTPSSSPLQVLGVGSRHVTRCPTLRFLVVVAETFIFSNPAQAAEQSTLHWQWAEMYGYLWR